MTENISGSSTSYNISTSVVAKGSVVSTCDDGICKYSLEVIQDLCSEKVEISVSAINELGQGPSTEAIMIGMIPALITLISCDTCTLPYNFRLSEQFCPNQI